MSVIDDFEKMCFGESLKAANTAEEFKQIGLEDFRLMWKGQEFAYKQMLKWIAGYRLENAKTFNEQYLDPCKGCSDQLPGGGCKSDGNCVQR